MSRINPINRSNASFADKLSGGAGTVAVGADRGLKTGFDGGGLFVGGGMAALVLVKCPIEFSRVRFENINITCLLLLYC